MNNFLFYLIAGLVTCSALAVVVSSNIVRAATWLLFSLAGVAGIFFLLGAEFIGSAQLLIYVGGTMILVVFGVMLTAQGPFVNMKTGVAEWVISSATGLLLFAVLAVSVVAAPGAGPGGQTAREVRSGFGSSPRPEKTETVSSTRLGLALLGVDQATPPGELTGPGKERGRRKSISYLLPFEIVSVHLLVVLIGAAYLARTKRREGAKA
jgi:NADH:ubiquinone oxidoreductase subunit 6 (subunit J)